jgi:hypothetical protein
MTNKHEILLDKITEWLEQEAEGQEVIDEYEGGLRPKCTDGTDDIIEGRVESANALLEQIKKWETEDDEAQAIDDNYMSIEEASDE